MDCRETQELLDGYLDHELDPVKAAEIESHLRGCPDCQRTFADQKAIVTAIRENATYFSAPQGLRARIRSQLPAPRERRFPLAPWAWLGFGAALASAVVLTWGLTLRLAVPSATEHVAEEVISSHVRSLMANHMSDVASSDQHTVKPWFAGKLDFSPPVTDLATEGFALAGGRLDYVNRRPVAALVYHRHKHVINLFVWPDPGAKNAAPQTILRQGYNLVHWTRSGMNLWAVSDLNVSELTELARLLGVSSS